MSPRAFDRFPLSRRMATPLCGGLLAVMVALFAWLAVAPRFVPLAPGQHVAADTVSFWAAGRLAAAGEAGRAYDTAALDALQDDLAGAPLRDHEAFLYPPLFLLLCLPLGAMAFLPAAAAWLAATLALYAFAMRRLLGRSLLLPALAYPAVTLNLLYGQNACLSTGLLALATAMLDAAPFRAGLCLGALAFKPQLGLFVPIALLATGRWRAVAGAAAMAAILSAAAAARFGPAIWSAWFRHMAVGTDALAHGRMGFDRLVSVYGAARAAGIGPAAAGLAQATAAVAVATVLWLGLRPAPSDRRPAGAWRTGAMLGAAMPLGSPFLLDYDLLLLAVPLGLSFLAMRRDGGTAPGLCLALLLFVAPIVAKLGAATTGLPLGVVEAPAALWLAATRVPRGAAIPAAPSGGGGLAVA